MTHVTIIGTGNMGQAIAGVVTRGGNTVELIGADDSGTQVSGDIVILAVPFPAISDLLAARGASLAGRVVVYITNPLDFQTFDSLTVPAGIPGPADHPGRGREDRLDRRLRDRRLTGAALSRPDRRSCRGGWPHGGLRH